MKAIVQTRYGSLDYLELQEVAKPLVGEADVLVRVRAASLHPDVWHVVMGRPYLVRVIGRNLSRPQNPIPGTDVAGIVESVGTSVTRFHAGDAVFGETHAVEQWVNGGAFAEFVAVRQDLLAPKPDNVTFEQAASVPTSGYIALLNLRDHRRMQAGKFVLINGAGGGVGSIALQIVKARGAHVTAVDSTNKLAMLHALGADEVVDFTQEDFTQRRTRYDFIFDVPGNHPFSACRRALRPDGRYVLIGHERFGAAGSRLFGIIPRFIGLIARSGFDDQLRGPGTPLPTKPEAIAVLADLMKTGALTPVIDSTYPLSQVREAFRHMIEDETLGKVIITPGPVPT